MEKEKENIFNRKLKFLSISSLPSVNFINILRAAFAPVDPKRVKRY